MSSRAEAFPLVFFIAILVIPPFEGYFIVINTYDALIGNSHSVGIATQVFNNKTSVFKGRLAANNSLF
jgi:hypothetical protein